ncbi:hypothetical protein M9458_006907, partial [Cirrhinus mrigala]
EHAATPAHHQPASSTCCSNELTPSGPSLLTPVLQSSSLILSPEPAASTRTPATASSWTRDTAPSQTPAAAILRTPATPPRSGLPAENMASHINLKDIVDSCGLFSPLSPLVPSSSPSSPLVPSSPLNSPLVQSIPPERPPEPELPPERPPELAPPERPPVPAPPECLPVSTPPKPGLPVLSWAGNALRSPKLPELPDLPWHPGLYAPSWLPELPDPPWRHTSSPSLVCPARASRAPTLPPRCICYGASHRTHFPHAT